MTGDASMTTASEAKGVREPVPEPADGLLDKPAESSRLDAALDYASRGWPVLPLHTARSHARCSCGRADCSSPGKHPRTEHGVKDATTDENTIRSWWKEHPTANVGIALALCLASRF